MEALKRELERKKREKAALLSSLSDNNDNKNNNKGDGVNSAPTTTSTKNKFMSKKQREEHLFRVAAANARERESEEEKKKKRSNGNAEEEEEEEEETTRNKISTSSSSVAAVVRAFAGGGGGGNAATNTNASKFRSAAARRAFENDEKSKNNDEKSGSKNEREEEELHKRIEREVKNLTNAEVIARLRKLGQPAKLFAEKEEDRRMRLEVAAKNIKVRETDEHVGGQQANELLKYNREKNNSKDDGNNNNGSNNDKSGTKNGGVGGDKNNNATTTTTNNSRKLTTKEQEIEKKKREAEMAQLEFERAAKRLKKQMDAETDPNAHPIDRVAEHFKRLLKEWAMDIEGTKFDSNAQKRQQVANCELTKTHMKPLFKKMKKRDLPNDIERALFLIFEAMKARDYKRATDAYVGVAIGNAAWPIGVTSVGIHDRSAREKISATTQAHAMQDEETRKYLQSVKRLITFSQRAYPTNPSLGFDWNGNDKKALEHAERATPGFLNASLPALPDGGGEQRRPKHNANVTDDGGRKWESLMRHAYDNVKTGG
jgi:pre-mRNA-splicing factor 18